MSTGSDDRSLAELEEERDFLLRSLEDLERERSAGDVTEKDYAELKEGYTGRAAAVLGAIETARHRRPSDAAAAPLSSEPRTPWWRSPRSIALGVGVVAFAVVVGILLARAVGERLPDDPLTGAVTPTGVSDDLARAQQLIRAGRTLDAIQLYDRILEQDPRQPEALAYRGWLVRLVGREANNPELVDRGLEFLDRAVAADPGYPDAHFFRGMVLLEDKGDPARAVPDFRAYLASKPPAELVPLVEGKLNEALAQSGQAPAPPGQEPAPPSPAPPPPG